MIRNLALASLAILLVSADVPKGGATTEPVMERCIVRSVDNQIVPASDSGVLLAVLVKEGDRVKEGDELARIDDREAKAVYDVRMAEFEAAEQKANSTFGIEYAKATKKVAETDLISKEKTNASVKGAVPEIDMVRARHEVEKAGHGIQKELEDQITNQKVAKAKAAEVNQAKVGLTRRTLRAPYDGTVVRLYGRVGEWMSPGDRVVQIVRTDRLRVPGTVDATQYNSAELEDRPVTVEVMLPGHVVRNVPGKITFVNPTIGPGKTYEVLAEINSPVENGRPVVRDGMEAKVTIHVNQPPVAAAVPVAGRSPAAAGARGASGTTPPVNAPGKTPEKK